MHKITAASENVATVAKNKYPVTVTVTVHAQDHNSFRERGDRDSRHKTT